jgi:hypothetical protein
MKVIRVLERYLALKETFPLWYSYYRLKLKRVIRRHVHSLTIALTMFVLAVALTGLALLGSYSSGLPTGYAVAEPAQPGCGHVWEVGGRTFHFSTQCEGESINKTTEAGLG